MRDCKALSTGIGYTSLNTPVSTGGVNLGITGFISRGGYGNIFERCIANATQGLTVTGASSFVAGFALMQDDNGILEQCSKIIDCEAANATTSPDGVTVPYGILLEAQIDGLVSVTLLTAEDGICPAAVFEVAWSPDGKYVAAAGSTNVISGKFIFIYEFNRLDGQLTLVATISPPNQTYEVDSLKWSPDGIHLISGSFDALGESFFCLYSFDRINNLLVRINMNNAMSDFIFDVEWSSDGKYIAVLTSATTNNFLIYKFDPILETVTQVASTLVGTGGASAGHCTWSPDNKHIALVGDLGSDALYIYHFDRGTNALVSKISTSIWWR